MRFFDVEITEKQVWHVQVDGANVDPKDVAEQLAAQGRGILLCTDREFTGVKERVCNEAIVKAIRDIVTPENVRLGHTWLKRKLIEAIAVVETGK